MPTIDRHLPVSMRDGKIKRYVEPFGGGGAVFFHIKQMYPIQEFHIGDLNRDLVNVYVVIRDKLDPLLHSLQAVAGEYLPLEHADRAAVFYRIRDEYNSTPGCLNWKRVTAARVQRAAQAIFLNRTCFNGLYRVNSRGCSNVPHGRYKTPPICDENGLRSASLALQGVNISCGSYEMCEPHVDARSFVYLDPPYRPLPNTPSFTAYAQTASFGDEDQKKLADFYLMMHRKGASLMLSNSDPHVTDDADDFFDDLYEDFNIHRVVATRAINSDPGKRGAISEILVTNYRVKA